MEKRELKKKVRALLSGGRCGDRETHLALAFVRGVPYAVLEERINEDKFELPDGARENKTGLFGFLLMLAQSVSVVVEHVEHPENKTHGYPGKRFDEIYAWMMVKYPEPVAAELSAPAPKESAA